MSKAEDEDEYKNDDDPEGFKLYRRMVSACKTKRKSNAFFIDSIAGRHV